jgi:hypothetical protein
VADQLNAYDKGILSGVTQYGDGDCVGSWALVWDGREFRQSHVDKPGMCRRKVGFWSFPTFVTEVIGEDGLPRVSDLNPGPTSRQRITIWHLLVSDFFLGSFLNRHSVAARYFPDFRHHAAQRDKAVCRPEPG